MTDDQPLEEAPAQATTQGTQGRRPSHLLRYLGGAGGIVGLAAVAAWLSYKYDVVNLFSGEPAPAAQVAAPEPDSAAPDPRIKTLENEVKKLTAQLKDKGASLADAQKQTARLTLQNEIDRNTDYSTIALGQPPLVRNQQGNINKLVEFTSMSGTKFEVRLHDGFSWQYRDQAERCGSNASGLALRVDPTNDLVLAIVKYGLDKKGATHQEELAYLAGVVREKIPLNSKNGRAEHVYTATFEGEGSPVTQGIALASLAAGAGFRTGVESHFEYNHTFSLSPIVALNNVDPLHYTFAGEKFFPVNVANGTLGVTETAAKAQNTHVYMLRQK